MKHFGTISILVLQIFSQMATAQDVRTLETKIADLLVQMPANDLAYRDKLAEETYSLGLDGLTRICSLVIPPGAGDDTRARFAIESLSKYLSREAPSERSEIWEKVCIAFATGNTDKYVKAFFMSQLQWMGSTATVEALAPYMADDILYHPAIAAIKKADPVKAGELFVSVLPSLSGLPRIETVKALGELKVTAACQQLEEMADQDNGADLQGNILRALASIGHPGSFKTLMNEAKSVKFLPEPTGATMSLLEYARELGRNGNTELSNDICQVLMKKSKSLSQVHFKSYALTVYAENIGIEEATPLLVTAMGDQLKSYRMTAINLALEHTGPASPWMDALEKTKDPEIRSEILFLLAGLQDRSAVPSVDKCLDDPDPAVRSEALRAVASIEGPAGVEKIFFHMLQYPGDPDLPVAKAAILSAAGTKDLEPLIGKIGNAPDPAKVVLLEIFAEKGDPEFFEVLMEYVPNGNKEVGFAAVRGLKKVAVSKNLGTLLGLLEAEHDPEWNAEIQEAVIVSVKKSANKSEQIDEVLSSMEQAGDKASYIPVLSGIGGGKCLRSVHDLYGNSQGETKELALQALVGWSDGTAIPVLYDICEATRSGPVFRGYVEQVARSGYEPEQQLLLLRKIMPLATNDEQRNQVVATCGQIKTFLGLMYVSGFMKDEHLRQNAVSAAVRIALPTPGNNDGLYGDKVREILSAAKEMLTGPESPYIKTDIETYLKSMPDDPGFVSLFNGKDLSGWQGLVEDPVARAKMGGEELASKQAEADELMRMHWLVENGQLVYRGDGYDNICTVRGYCDFELLLDWKIDKNGDSGIYLRGSPQVQIWDAFREDMATRVGSGGLFNNQVNESKPLQVADNMAGDWNTFRIIMMGERVSVYLNGVLVVDNVILENYWDRNLPIFPSGPIELQAHASECTFRNIYIREIQGVELSPEERSEGFVLLFNGKNLDGWTGNKINHVVEDGTIAVRPGLGGHGNLYTEDEYANFILRLEFKLTPGANNGLGIRAPLEGDAAYVGMEFQILDNTAEVYANLKPWQYHGSVYGVIPAKRGYLRPVGEWNEQEVIVDGTHIRIILNGTTIVDGDISDSIRNGTMDGKDHPGLKRKSGHIGFLGHGSELWYRNIRIKEL